METRLEEQEGDEREEEDVAGTRSEVFDDLREVAVGVHLGTVFYSRSVRGAGADRNSLTRSRCKQSAGAYQDLRFTSMSERQDDQYFCNRLVYSFHQGVSTRFNSQMLTELLHI